MKIVVFAGGTGRRLWPISRQRSPKQFEPIVGAKSTVRLVMDRVQDKFGTDNVFVSTNVRYLEILRDQLPDLPEANFIGEPLRRDLAAAVGLAMVHLDQKFGADEPVAIIWGDNYMTDVAAFLGLMDAAETILQEDMADIVFIGETARFANPNLGWIELGDSLGRVQGQHFYAYKSWLYRPQLEECQRMFDSGRYVWNTGYFVTSPGFVIQAYQEFQPSMWDMLHEIGATIGTDEYPETLHKIYPELEVASFDDAIVQHIRLDQAVVLHGRMGWSDPGTLYALKESINPDTEANVEKGLVRATESKDCLLYNYEEDKLMAVAGLEGMVVVNTKDAILVVHKDHVALVKELVNGLVGTELERFS